MVETLYILTPLVIAYAVFIPVYIKEMGKIKKVEQIIKDMGEIEDKYEHVKDDLHRLEVKMTEGFANINKEIHKGIKEAVAPIAEDVTILKTKYNVLFGGVSFVTLISVGISIITLYLKFKG